MNENLNINIKALTKGMKKVFNGNTIYYYRDCVLVYTYYKNSSGFESWKEYSNKGKVIYFKNSKGAEKWYEHDEVCKTYYKDPNEVERGTPSKPQKAKHIEHIKYDFDHNGLVPEVIHKLNEIIDAVNALQE